ncbi:conserved exported hypothetical protein [Candidatus Sulfopaludibacter sp. SbA3]|nr:conserved exported hypothetical protein [Candidatus Sulfopaludibacter sp. SbA3]
MNTSTMRLMIATAALAVAAGTASAQAMKAEIPMSFRANGKLMPPGSYEVREDTGHGYIRVRKLDSDRSAMMGTGVTSDAPKMWREAGSPMLSFVCAGESCTLTRFWNGKDSFTHAFTAPKPPATDLEAQQTRVVTLAMIRIH